MKINKWVKNKINNFFSKIKEEKKTTKGELEEYKPELERLLQEIHTELTLRSK